MVVVMRCPSIRWARPIQGESSQPEYVGRAGKPSGESTGSSGSYPFPGAVSIPIDELGERIGELPTDVDVIVYCRGEYCVFAYRAVRLLTDRGRRAIRLNDGMLAWRLADLPVAT